MGSRTPAGRLALKAGLEEETGLAHAGLQPLELSYVVHSNHTFFSLLADSDKNQFVLSILTAQ